MEITLNNEGFVENYAVIGDIEGSITVQNPQDMPHFSEHYEAYKLVDGKLVFDENKGKAQEKEILAQKQLIKQQENNLALAKFFECHPILWNDGKLYGITQEDQQEIALNLTQYQLTVSAGLPAKLKWHAVHEECREFTQEELSALALTISNYVYPYIRQNQSLKVQIFATNTLEELEAINIEYKLNNEENS